MWCCSITHYNIPTLVTNLHGLTNLYDGTGDPWAGQLQLNGELIPTLNEPRVSELDENLGDDVPIGSEI